LESKPSARRSILIWLIVSQLLALKSLFATVVGDYAIFPIAFAISAWIAYARKRDKLAAILNALTILPVLMLMLVILLIKFSFPYGF
jgi:hypothetical protein